LKAYFLFFLHFTYSVKPEYNVVAKQKRIVSAVTSIDDIPVSHWFVNKDATQQIKRNTYQFVIISNITVLSKQKAALSFFTTKIKDAFLHTMLESIFNPFMPTPALYSRIKD